MTGNFFSGFLANYFSASYTAFLEPLFDDSGVVDAEFS